MRPALISLICLMAGACTQFPEVDSAKQADVDKAKFPKVVPMDDLTPPPVARLDESSEAQLEGRINGLKRRASDLQALDPE